VCDSPTKTTHYHFLSLGSFLTIYLVKKRIQETYGIFNVILKNWVSITQGNTKLPIFLKHYFKTGKKFLADNIANFNK
jgi:hypothetical protein